MRYFRLAAAIFFLAAITACAGKQNLNSAASPAERIADLNAKYNAIIASRELLPPGAGILTEDGGVVVLTVARDALAEGYAEGKWPDVTIVDLWTHAIKEGGILFNQPDKRWGRTTAEETADMIGQTTIGPWQMTIQNVKNIYGAPYGIDSSWPESKIYVHLREHPEIQAKMIADYIQLSYDTFGRRSPYAIQRYFWLDAFVKGEIGQGPWQKSVLPKAPDGDWRKLTPEMKADTGFYAKQIVCGSEHNPYGMLYWLWVTNDTEGIEELLRTWRDETRLVSGGGENYTDTGEPTNFDITVGDLMYLERFPQAHAAISAIVKRIGAE